MRCSSPRGLFVPCLVCLSLWLGGIQGLATADDSAPVVEDHPLVVVTAASIDRLLERAELLTSLVGKPVPKAALAAAMTGDRPLLKGVDVTKPAGVMFFFSLDAVMQSGSLPSDGSDTAAVNDDNSGKLAIEGDEPPLDLKEPPKAGKPLPSKVEGEGEDVDGKSDSGQASSPSFFDSLGMAAGEFDMERMVVFVPITNFDAVLETLKLTPVTAEPGTYTSATHDFFSPGDSIAVRRIGNYMLIGTDADLVTHSPDPRSVVRPLLGKHDLVVSLQAKGLPVGLRTLGAEGLKLAYAAILQQQDNEPKPAYELRRATGELIAELLDLALSHIDAVNLGVRIDPDQKQLVAEFDVVGTEHGKLAKFAKEWTPKRSAFAGLWQEEGPFSLGLSLAIPERHAKAVSTAMSRYVQQANETDKATFDEFAPVVKVAMKLLESGQLDLLYTSAGTTTEGSSILGIKILSDSKFPEQFQQMLEQSASLKNSGANFATAVDAVNGYPVHTAPSDIYSKLFGIGVGQSDQSNGRFSLTATPDAIWLATSTGATQPIVSDLLRLAVEQTSSKQAKPAGSNARNIAPLRITFHSNIMSSGTSGTVDPNEIHPQVRQAQLEQAAREQQEQEVVKAIFQEKGDAVRFELRPSATGLQLTIRLEEAYLALYGHLFAEAVSGSTGDTND